MDWTDFVDDRPFVAPIMTDEEGNYYYASPDKTCFRWLIIIAAIIIVLLLFYIYVV